MQKYLVALGVMACLFVLPTVAGASGLVPACGGAGEPGCQACYVVELVNNVVTWLVMILGVIAAILIVVAGSRLVISGGNHHAMEEAKSSMSNLIIGYIIVLSAWLVLDYGLKALLVEDGRFGVWNEVSCVVQPIAEETLFEEEEVVWVMPEVVLRDVAGWVTDGGSGGSGGSTAACTVLPGPPGVREYDCTVQQTQCRNAGGTPSISAGGGSVVCASGNGSGGTGGNLPQCTNSYCSVTALMAAGMTSTQANVMSCIAMTESSGNPNIGPYNERHPGSNSSACGLFQIVRTTWNRYNSGGSCSNHATSCRNASCNTRVAVNLVRSNGFRDWTCPNCNENAIRCIRRYGG